MQLPETCFYPFFFFSFLFLSPDFNCACSSSEHCLAVSGSPLPTCPISACYYMCVPAVCNNNGDKLKKKSAWTSPAANTLFPRTLLSPDERPDIIVWNASSVHMVELTIPFETGIEDAASRKQTKYAELVESCRRNGFHATLTTVKVASRGFIHVPGFTELYKIVNASSKARSELEREVICQANEGSFCIWCKRNWREE